MWSRWLISPKGCSINCLHALIIVLQVGEICIIQELAVPHIGIDPHALGDQIPAVLGEPPGGLALSNRSVLRKELHGSIQEAHARCISNERIAVAGSGGIIPAGARAVEHLFLRVLPSALPRVRAGHRQTAGASGCKCAGAQQTAAGVVAGPGGTQHAGAAAARTGHTESVGHTVVRHTGAGRPRRPEVAAAAVHAVEVRAAAHLVGSDQGLAGELVVDAGAVQADAALVAVGAARVLRAADAHAAGAHVHQTLQACGAGVARVLGGGEGRRPTGHVAPLVVLGLRVVAVGTA